MTPGLPSPGKGIVLMLMAIFIFTAMDALAKHMLQSYPTVQVVWARFAGNTVIVMAVLAPRLGAVMRTRRPGLQALRSLTQVASTVFFFSALPHIGLAEATAIIDVNPVLITLGAALFLGERLGPRRLIGVGLALVGAMIVIRPGSGVFQPAALLPLGAAFSYAAHALLTRKLGSVDPVWTSVLYGTLLGTIVTSLVVPFHWQPVAAGDLWAFGLIGLLGAASQVFMIRAYATTEASVLAPFGYVGLVLASGWGLLLFDEVPDRWTILGAAVIVAAGLYVWHRERQAARARR
jgi:drug/metabolite transporter (DMT)-like permease